MLKIVNSSGTILAYLNNSLQGKVKEGLNGEYVLPFLATIDPLKTDFLYDEKNLIEYDGDLFQIIDIQELHDEDNMLTVAVNCEHISYRLLDSKFVSFDYNELSAIEAMNLALAGSGFTLRTCDILEKHPIRISQSCNAKQVIIEIARIWKGELRYDNKYIDLVKERGQNRGTGFIFGKNLKSVSRTINRADDTLTYEVSITESPTLDELGYYELGDTVRIMDHRLNVDIYKKIVSIEKDILTGINNNVTLGDMIADIRNSFNDVSKEVEQVNDRVTDGAKDWDKITNVTDELGNVIVGKLDQITDVASKIVNSTGTYVHMDNGMYWQDQPTHEASTFATMWSAQGITFANEKNLDGSWKWQTALDAEGLIANKVTAKALYGMLIEAANIRGAVIEGGTIIGTTIEGSTVMAGDIEMTGSISWNMDSSPVKAQYSVTGTSNWHTIFTPGDIYARYSYDGGKTWTAGVRIVGEDGDKGDKGDTGATGPKGDKGEQGLQGIQGPKGDKGIQGPAGSNGQTTYFHIKYSPVSNPTSGQMSELPNTYIGTYVDFVEADSTDPSKYQWARFEGVQGQQGTQGIPGQNGSNGQTSYLHIKYSNVPNPTSSSQINESGGDYIGQYTDFVVVDSDNPSRYTWTKIKGEQGIQGPKGDQGLKGLQGDKGEQGIQGPSGTNGQTTYFHIKYSEVPNPTSAQMTETPSKYIGTYVDFTASDSTDPNKYIWSRFEGIQGAQGDQGIPGNNGTDGKTSYLHIKYSDVSNPTSSSQMNESGGDYIGQYTDFIAADSNDPTKYTWTKIKGEQGVPGIQGPSGANGQSLYTWVKYADNVTGSGMSDLPDGKKYIGMAYNKTTPTESNLAKDYSWSLIKGDQGIQGPSGANGESLYTWLKYATTPTSGMSDSPTGKSYMGVAYNKTTPTESTNYADYSWSLIKGEQGVPGVQGPAGSNGESLYTWVKYADTATGTGMSDLPDGKKYIGMAYNKTTSTESTNASDYSWSLIKGDKGDTGANGAQGSQGIPGPAGTNGKTLYTWLKYADTPTSGMSDSPTNKKYMGLAYNKESATESSTYSDYSWSLIKGDKGDTGSQGPQGPQGPSGPKGEDGINGAPGVPGPAGEDGRPTYTWVKYGYDENGSGIRDIIGQFQVNEMNKPLSYYSDFKVDNLFNYSYMGMAYNKPTSVESTTPTDYEWGKIVGVDGNNGVTYYTWIVYADNEVGGGMTTNPKGKPYMGIRYNALTPVMSNDPSEYTWVKIKGENGSDANIPPYIHETYIDSTIIKSPTIQGNVVNAGVVTGGYIRGTTIEGATITAGDPEQLQAIMTPTDPLSFSSVRHGRVLYFNINGSGSSELVFYRLGAVQGTLGGGSLYTELIGENKLSLLGKTKAELAGRKSVSIRTEIEYDNSPNLNAQNEWFFASGPNKYCEVGNHFGKTYITGQATAYNLQSRSMSENEVVIMEQEVKIETLEKRLNDLELLLMEKGVI